MRWTIAAAAERDRPGVDAARRPCPADRSRPGETADRRRCAGCSAPPRRAKPSSASRASSARRDRRLVVVVVRRELVGAVLHGELEADLRRRPSAARIAAAARRRASGPASAPASTSPRSSACRGSRSACRRTRARCRRRAPADRPSVWKKPRAHRAACRATATSRERVAQADAQLAVGDVDLRALVDRAVDRRARTRTRVPSVPRTPMRAFCSSKPSSRPTNATFGSFCTTMYCRRR